MTRAGFEIVAIAADMRGQLYFVMVAWYCKWIQNSLRDVGFHKNTIKYPK